VAFKALKTEHSGSKKGRGAYWGRKVDAKRESNGKRREDTKAIVRDTRLQAEKGSKAEKGSRNR
jgi:predicted aminopeptidase